MRRQMLASGATGGRCPWAGPILERGSSLRQGHRRLGRSGARAAHGQSSHIPEPGPVPGVQMVSGHGDDRRRRAVDAQIRDMVPAGDITVRVGRRSAASWPIARWSTDAIARAAGLPHPAGLLLPGWHRMECHPATAVTGAALPEDRDRAR